MEEKIVSNMDFNWKGVEYIITLRQPTIIYSLKGKKDDLFSSKYKSFWNITTEEKEIFTFRREFQIPDNHSI